MTYPPDPVPAVPAPISADPVPAGQIPTQEEIQDTTPRPPVVPFRWACPNGCGFVEHWLPPNDPPKTIDAHQQSCRPAGFT